MTPEKLAYHRKWKNENAESVRASRTRSKKKKKAAGMCVDCPSKSVRGTSKCASCSEKMMARQRANPIRRANQHRRLKYGITPEDFINILFAQNGRCRVCREFFVTRIHLDHDHNTKKLRGLLCARCNTSIWLLEDEILMENMKKYLKGDYGGLFDSRKSDTTVRGWVL